MNVLDELRKKAEQKKAQEQQQAVNNDELEWVYVTELLPKMQYLYNNLNESIEYLNFLEEPLVVKNYSSRYPQFGKLLQKNYKINTDGRLGNASYERIMQINISFFCEGPGEFSYSLLKKLSYKETEFLNERGLIFKSSQLNDTMQTFTVKRKVPVRFSIKVDYELSKLMVAIENYENLESFNKSFTAEQLDEDFLDSLLSYFLRRDNRFIQPDINEDYKALIQSHLVPFQEQQQDLLKEALNEAREKEDNKRFSFKKIFGK